MDQGNVTPSGQQVPSPPVRPAPVAPRRLRKVTPGLPNPPQTAPAEAETAAGHKTVSAEGAREVAAMLNGRPDFSKFKARVTVDEGSDKVVVQILARNSGEVVQQLPIEGILQFAEKLNNANVSGILLDEHM